MGVMQKAERMQQLSIAAAGAIPDTMIEHLYEIGYFTAPASKDHHGAYTGGLFDHSLQVAVQLSNITHKMGLVWQRPESPIIVGLLHDYVKIYEYDWIPNEKTGEIQIAYSKAKPFPGHGEASVMLLQQYLMENPDMIITTEEMMCIRYHMGAFVDKHEWEYYSKAVHNYPNILWTHTADMIASQVKGV